MKVSQTSLQGFPVGGDFPSCTFKSPQQSWMHTGDKTYCTMHTIIPQITTAPSFIEDRKGENLHSSGIVHIVLKYSCLQQFLVSKKRSWYGDIRVSVSLLAIWINVSTPPKFKPRLTPHCDKVGVCLKWHARDAKVLRKLWPIKGCVISVVDGLFYRHENRCHKTTWKVPRVNGRKKLPSSAQFCAEGPMELSLLWGIL